MRENLLRGRELRFRILNALQFQIDRGVMLDITFHEI